MTPSPFIPHRIQRKRTRGWRMPENTIYVGRPTKWGNHWQVGKRGCGCRTHGECNHNSYRVDTPADAVEAYIYFKMDFKKHNPYQFEKWIKPLRGKNLVCWCPVLKNGAYHPCHADVLLALANDFSMDQVKARNLAVLECNA